MIYDEYIEKLMQHYTSGEYQSEVDKAKKNFYENAGVFNEESSDLEVKMSQFMDWYLFSRPLNSEGLTPVQKAISENSDFDIAEADRKKYLNIAANRHSLFEFLKLKAEDLYVRDLFSGYKMTIRKSPIIIGFNKNEIFESRLLPYEDNFIFASSFCVHPAEASKYIKKEIKAVKKLPPEEQDKARSDLMLKLFKMRHKLDQYKHVKLKDIYTNNPKLRI